jgi:fibro-slime domain-containing protein
MKRRHSFVLIAIAASGVLAFVSCNDVASLVIAPPAGAGGGGPGGDGPGAAGGDGGQGLGFVPAGGGDVGGAGGATGGGPPAPACGDGMINPGEVCDDANGDSGDGCSANCDAIENGFACPVPGQPCVSTVVCSDGEVTGTETCDDQNTDSGDGCDATCQVEPGWVCPVIGAQCVAAQCGDGILAGDEECEDDDVVPASGDGCDATCAMEPGYKCPVPAMPCIPTVCGDGVAEGSEQCDDANHDMGDGCTPFCVNEPICVGQAPCTTSCGDGIMLPMGMEQCEDANTDDGDGCSSTCMVEPGYLCMDVSANPSQLVLPIVVRDFQIAHPDMQYVIGVDPGIVQQFLGPNGKPVYNGLASNPTTTGQANFDQWYADTPGVNITILQTLTLTLQPNGTFLFNDATFFPIDGQGFGNEGNGNNFHFTSEVRYWFEYQGNEQLDFTGDDDVWVFVNKELAVDLGGVHGAMSGGVLLDAAAATTFNLSLGEIYEIVVFQAERHTTQSNYQLTLGNFVNSTSDCDPVCGDGIKTPDEVCDDGINDGSYGHCTIDCLWGPYCGDGILQVPFEECDDGDNLTPYEGCAPGCVEGAFCGDGVVDSLFGEECDDGANDGGYGECAPGCVLGPRCGDGVLQPTEEECDDGNKVSGDGCDLNCNLESAN